MITSFKNIFQVRLLHNYYTDNQCSDFSFFPLGETTELMRNHQALFRSESSAIRTLILANETATSARNPFATNAALYFGMALNNPGFSNFTNEYPTRPRIFLFSNENNLADPSLAPVELGRREIELSGPVITHTIRTPLAVSLVLKNEAGETIETKSFPAASDDVTYQFDIQRHAKGLYTVTENTPAPADYSYYADADLLFSSIFGIIRIVNQSSFNFTYDGKPLYTISFTTRSSAWSYYVVAPGLSGTDINTSLSIFDAGRTGPAAIAFTKTYPVPANDTTAPLLYNDLSKIALFTSDNPLAWQQAPRKRIELRRNGTTLLSDLPNPDLRNPGTNMYITI